MPLFRSSPPRNAAVGIVLAAVTAGVAVHAIPADASPGIASHTPPAVETATQYTRQTLDLTGTWRLTSVFTSRLGRPILPGSFPGNDVYAVLHLESGVVAPPGNEPVYTGSLYDAATRTIIAGELQVSPYVSPRGVVLTMWQAGNPEGFADAYEAVYTVQGVNSTASPLSFTGTWIDQDHNGGTTTLRPVPEVLSALIDARPASSPGTGTRTPAGRLRARRQ